MARPIETCFLLLCGGSLVWAVTPSPSLFERQPLRFEEASGTGFAYVAHGHNYQLAIGAARNDLTWTDPRTHTFAVIRTRFPGANRRATVQGLDPVVAQTNYFLGSASSKWRTGIQNYSRVRVSGIYPGIDLLFHENAGKLEYDFVCAPGADPSAIRFRIDGARRITVDASGDLVLATAAGDVRWQRPEVRQDDTRVAGGFELTGKNTVRFHVADYDRSRALVIDPTLSYGTYFGGSGNDWARAIATDGSGNVYITGITSSGNLTVTGGAFQTTYGGQTVDNITGDVFVAKFSPTGTLLWSTFLGGSADDGAFGLAVDSAGNAYVTGFTNSSNFPVTQGVFQSKFGGFGGNSCNRFGDAFVAKLNPAGTQLIYSTYLGGSLDDIGAAITIDSSGNAYVAGASLSRNFPVTSGVVQGFMSGSGGQIGRPNCNGAPAFDTGDAFITKMNPTGTALIWSTYLGGGFDDAAMAIALDSSQNVYVAGATLSTDFPTQNPLQSKFGGTDPLNEFFHSGDGFVAKLNSSGTSLIYSTYLGGNGDDAIYSIFVDAAGTAYVTGPSSSQNLPVTSKAVQSRFGGYYNLPPLVEQNQGDTFVAHLNATGNALLYATYLGGSANEIGTGITVDSAGLIYVVGASDSTDFPVTSNALQKIMDGDGGLGNYVPVGDGFLAIIDPNSTSLVYSSYLGGSMDDWFSGVTLDSSGNLWTVGGTLSTNFPVTANAAQKSYGGDQPSLGQRGDAILVKFATGGGTGPNITGVQNAAGYTSNLVSPGMVFVLYGNNFGPPALTSGSYDANGNLATTQSGATIYFDSHPAPIVYTSATLASGIVPYEVYNQTSTQITVNYNGQTSAPFTVPVQAAVPGIFSADFTGSGAAFAFNHDLTRNSPANPAAATSLIVVFGTGEGQTLIPGTDGKVVTDPNLLTKPILTCTATVGGQPAVIDYCGTVPDVVEGEFQLNLHSDANVGSGPQKIVVSFGPYQSQANLVVYIQ